MSTDTRREIEERAFAWLALRDSGSCNEAEQKAFAEWIQADMAHRIAYLRLESSWERSAKMKAIGVGMKRGQVPPPGQWRTSPFFKRRTAFAVRAGVERSVLELAAIAAGVVLAIGGGFYLQARLAGDAYSTSVGKVESVSLPDGSKMTLNTASQVLVALTDEERHIELRKGEAFFDVAKDPSRPFVVEVGDRRVIAVGTRFSVRRQGSKVQVVVTQGAVRVLDHKGNTRGELLTAGTVLRTARQSQLVQKKTVDQVEEVLSWRRGYLTFDETTLADAVAEMNRYTTRRIVIEDPTLETLRMSGKFRSTNVEDFVELLRTGFGVEVLKSEERITLTAN